jgi:biotin operon repressor
LAGFQEEIQFEVLRRLHQTPQVSQRVLAKDLGVGFSTINFCLQALKTEMNPVKGGAQ